MRCKFKLSTKDNSFLLLTLINLAFLVKILAKRFF